MMSSSAMCCWDERTILPQEVKQTIQEAAKTHAKDILDQLAGAGSGLAHKSRHFHRRR